MSLTEFGNTAKKLTHNPLGIIALFIVLVYAFASLVGGFGANLDQTQKTPLIWFLVLFPVLVLLIFAWLVSRHHMKLYAPMDYRDEKLFVYPQSPESQRLRLLAEADDIEAQEPETNTASTQPGEETSPQLPIGIRERIPTVPSSRNEALSKYLLAEDLALRQLEVELRVPIAKQVEIVANNARAMFDGLVRTEREIIGIEVKYANRPHYSTSMIQSALFRFVDVSSRIQHSNKDISLKFIFVFVTEFSGEELELFKNRIVSRYQLDLVPVEWRFYSFTELKQRFGIHEGQA